MRKGIKGIFLLSLLTLLCPLSTVADPGILGGLDLFVYCKAHGYKGFGAGKKNVSSHAPLEPGSAAILTRHTILGKNAAYKNWACLGDAGKPVLFKTGGGFPSFVEVCNKLYKRIPSYVYPADPDNAYTWTCYRQLPPSGKSPQALIRDVVRTLMLTDPVQAEIKKLKADRRSLMELDAYLAERSTRALIGDLMASYKLSSEETKTVTRALKSAIREAIRPSF